MRGSTWLHTHQLYLLTQPVICVGTVKQDLNGAIPGTFLEMSDHAVTKHYEASLELGKMNLPPKPVKPMACCMPESVHGIHMHWSRVSTHLPIYKGYMA